MQAARGTPLSEHEPPADPDRPDSGAAGPPARRRAGILLGVAVFVLISDIITKTIVVAALTGRAPVVLLGGFLKLTELRNPGAAFSIGGRSVTIVFTAIAVAVTIFILRMSSRIRSVPWAITLGLLLGGAVGNLVDRIFRYPGIFRGYVVDWIQFPHWPVFNLADSAIVCGGVLAVLLAMRGTRLDGQRVTAESDPADQPAAPMQGTGAAGGDSAAGKDGGAA
ncbi:MAG: signal peptidase II [Streptosporangiaceae bacterium]